MAQKRGYDPSVREKLDRVEWKSVWPRVIKFALQKENMLRRLGSEISFEDLIQEAITRMYGMGDRDSYRNWNPEKYDPAVFITFVIKDIVRDELNKLAGYKKEPFYEEDGSERNVKIDRNCPHTADLLTTKSLDDILVDEDSANELLNKLDEISSNSEDLGLLIMCYEEGITKPTEIAETTGFDITKVYHLKRKLKRKLGMDKPGMKKLTFMERREG